MQQNVRYRIGVVNDFTNEWSAVDFKQFGQLKIWDAFTVRGRHRGYQKADDSIQVYLNFTLVGEFNSKEAANQEVRRLIYASPEDITKFERYLIQ